MDQQEIIAHDDRTGHDLPNADGQVSDGDVEAIDDTGDSVKGGKDHSLDDYAGNAPTSGVGHVQDRSDTLSDIAHLEE